MQEHFEPDYLIKLKAILKSDETNNSPSLFGSSFEENEVSLKTMTYFYKDDNAWYHIESVVPEIDREKLHRDLKWFQEQIRKPKAERYKYYQTLDENNNELIIDKFCHLKEKPDKNGRVQAPYFTASLRDTIRAILNRIYCKK